jgi:hypothetical protein
MFPSPMLPDNGVGPKAHVPNAVVAKVWVKVIQVVVVEPSIVYKEAHTDVVGYCVGASVVAPPPPPAATCGSGAAVARARRRGAMRREGRERCMVETVECDVLLPK